MRADWAKEKENQTGKKKKIYPLLVTARVGAVPFKSKQGITCVFLELLTYINTSWFFFWIRIEKEQHKCELPTTLHT